MLAGRSSPRRPRVHKAWPAALAGAALALWLLQAAPARAEPLAGAAAPQGEKPAQADPPPTAEKICLTLAQAAADNALPIDLLTRLTPRCSNRYLFEWAGHTAQ